MCNACTVCTVRNGWIGCDACGRYAEALKLAVLTREAEDINDARKMSMVAVPTSRQRQITGTI